eukprot:CAMPEP_0115673604 /NCGR_PEP_ID=MMETSP0272-20121206/53183_1 /TAXON_ID=71861 /ORGANISM="Scrippsiella trochoidea, Strain CCMP3099" /LENGTH=150 /DNA_ID=CAMNT_0003112471 /DNA_START=84 /DNA_END=535 /DNA_ORIENTATION=+
MAHARVTPVGLRGCGIVGGEQAPFAGRGGAVRLSKEAFGSAASLGSASTRSGLSTPEGGLALPPGLGSPVLRDGALEPLSDSESAEAFGSGASGNGGGGVGGDGAPVLLSLAEHLEVQQPLGLSIGVTAPQPRHLHALQVLQRAEGLQGG